MVTNPAGGLNLLNPAIGVLNNLYGEVNVLGAIIDAPTEISINGVRTLTKQDLRQLDYDMILAAGDHASLVPIIQQADEFGIDINKTVLDRTVCVPNFTMTSYNRLRNSQLSILSSNCFAGVLYHRLGLPFLSPTINMFTSNEGFFKLLENPILNIAQEPILRGTAFEANLNFDYPIFEIGGTKWHMNHYSDFDLALNKWHARRYKINWFNLMVVMYAENPDVLAEFDKLPFSKKVCFVPFETEADSGYYINPDDHPAMKLWQMVNNTASGRIIHYDIWDMLLYGKKTPLQVVYK